jgi:hypothetical protein
MSHKRLLKAHRKRKLNAISYIMLTNVYLIVLYPEKGECADPVNEDAILEEEGGGESQDRNRERQLAPDTGGGKT